ncbi:MAG: alpha/beta hydrolase, partial [Bacteroidota bacterium]
MTKKLIILFGILFGSILLLLLVANSWLNNQKNEPFTATAEEQENLAFYQQPEKWFIENLTKPQIQLDGQTLDPKFQYMFEQAGDSEENFGMMKNIFATSLGRKFVRNAVDREWTLYTKTSPSMEQTHDLEVTSQQGHQIPIRIYVPKSENVGEKLPVLLYAHGGGYLFGSIKALDRAVQIMANEAQAIVVSIDYRLAPEYPYPAASDDGETVFLWAKNNIQNYGGNPEKIAFGGDSGGGHVAINVAQRQLAQNAEPPVCLLLYYPATGLPIDDLSYELFQKGFGLDAKFFEYILTQVFPDQELATANPDAYMAPIQAESLAGIPPTIVATAGFDILRDSGKKFADRLAADSIDVTYFNYPSLAHSFLNFSGVIADAEQAA